MTTTDNCARRIVADRGDGARIRLHARAAIRRASSDRPDGRASSPTNEVQPALERLEQQGLGACRAVWFAGAGELGLLGTDVSDEFGGVGLDKVASIVVGESMGRAASFATTFGAQTGLAITPILCSARRSRKRSTCRGWSAASSSARMRSANPDQDRMRSAPKRARRGSRTAASRSTARRCGSPTAASPTSSSSSRKSTASEFTAFIVERAFPGVSNGKEEHKMGLHGSSTTPLILQDATVPAEQRARRDRQGPQGRVQRAQLRPLQAWRRCAAAARAAIVGEAAKYAAQRKQFGQPIAEFGAIKHKLGEMAIREFRHREHAVSHGRHDRSAHRIAATAAGRATRCWRRWRSSRLKRRS